MVRRAQACLALSCKRILRECELIFRGLCTKCALRDTLPVKCRRRVAFASAPRRHRTSEPAFPRSLLPGSTRSCQDLFTAGGTSSRTVFMAGECPRITAGHRAGFHPGRRTTGTSARTFPLGDIRIIAGPKRCTTKTPRHKE